MKFDFFFSSLKQNDDGERFTTTLDERFKNMQITEQ